ncbi:hypothetical protein [uncultured Aliiroseovarius sp.]|uniref:hypothetical protein n=1 Tax=uncultured Aliiroseovarius sp. TaxID=1658783 RepID=UPI00261DEAF3|nr:hypothetical protein [uncultured Aliiroseovarius sp.]
MDLTSFLVDEAVGLIGGAVFFGSWLLQAWQSRQAGQAIVSKSFFVLRALASALLTFEGIRVGSVSISLLMGATLLLMLYNVHLIRNREKRAQLDGSS